ncbi:hypothetical protein [Epibacterium ulvae]|uniref:hypothetical protein n=1 Tax=Epibacterium ulvae TaxID=1156985 RepID=UPI00248FD5ED|nr:hypothetical protein [Epibacterium ulvae]
MLKLILAPFPTTSKQTLLERHCSKTATRSVRGLNNNSTDQVRSPTFPLHRNMVFSHGKYPLGK